MTTHTANEVSRIDWRRIAALSTSFSAHALAVFVIALPLLPEPPRVAAHVVEAAVHNEPPPPPPIPPETLPQPKPPRHMPTHALPKPQPVQQQVVQVAEAPAIPEATAPVVPSTPATMENVPDGGASRILAYDGALKLRYPPASIRAREQGTVLLNVLVDANGKAQRIEIARSSGHPALDTAAREAVSHARFKPVLRNGVAVPAWGVVPIQFRLDNV